MAGLGPALECFLTLALAGAAGAVADVVVTLGVLVAAFSDADVVFALRVRSEAVAVLGALGADVLLEVDAEVDLVDHDLAVDVCLPVNTAVALTPCLLERRDSFAAVGLGFDSARGSRYRVNQETLVVDVCGDLLCHEALDAWAIELLTTEAAITLFAQFAAIRATVDAVLPADTLLGSSVWGTGDEAFAVLALGAVGVALALAVGSIACADVAHDEVVPVLVSHWAAGVAVEGLGLTALQAFAVAVLKAFISRWDLLSAFALLVLWWVALLAEDRRDLFGRQGTTGPAAPRGVAICVGGVFAS